ncbi:MAG TPA: YwiC-like family protein [Thermoanaerobaculia bacterium]|nr:YwiC-like family protein [Thermoanaerobaculia bacterium]
MTAIPIPARAVALRPLALPSEHGGWGFLGEPILLGLLIAPSWPGALLAAAAVFGFLARHPLKLALQDAVRGRSYPRTPWCRALAAGYSSIAAVTLIRALTPGVFVPLALALPFAVIQAAYDARNRSRELLPELSGAVAMTGAGAAIAIAGGMPPTAALGLAGILIARFVPAILYVRTLLGRSPAWIALTLHAVALAAVALWAAPLAVAAMIVLLMRALWGVTHDAPRAQTIGWREIVYGAVTVALVALGYR